MTYFLVVNEQGPAWNPSRSMREQEKWAEHASFMNSLVEEGFVVLGGPIRGGAVHKARLIVRSVSERALRARLAEDPWMQMGLLQTLTIEPWEVLLSKYD
ncbi:MAG: hypothetical protein ABSB97_07980 [Thermoplasmata archaeon]